jgi:thiosulfate reductase cytochrome b subunit
MDATAGPAPARAAQGERHRLVYRHSVATRLTHWIATLAFFVLVMSGLQIFNAAPYLDASDKSDPGRRVVDIGFTTNPSGNPAGYLRIFGFQIPTGHALGFTDDGLGSETGRAFPGWITLPGYQDLADGRRWHLFFAWIAVIAGLAYIVAGARRRDLALIVLRPSDLPKLVPMQLYYLRLRREPPAYGKYNPLQKLAYTLVLFVFAPLVVLSGLALSPGIDALAGPLTTLLGGRQFARLWHFAAMVGLIGFFVVHVILVLSTGVVNNLRSMITGSYELGKHEGLGP